MRPDVLVLIDFAGTVVRQYIMDDEHNLLLQLRGIETALFN